ncbi:hypothetical protein SAMN04487949_2229 [Halogranum gelatinilyticum]|uniref:Uncharacterized protein n=1 Tax=Halogranum gelatinilyticum TaxID=660521 RepID=A0A1G9UKK0_9EURY|nr:hypothetical protein [Halogranum gelatinilyticum]SDM60460.1 hypothetical protein SAMN04487949_2229 [Halogranum gelatinilyticum]
MATDTGRRFRPQISLASVVVAFLLGTLAHAVDQMLFVRAGPIPLLLTAPVVATLLYVRLRATTRQQVLALLGWGVVGSGLAVLGVYLRVVGYYLPRPLTPTEMVLYDFGMFLWFVLGLSAVYVLAARRTGRTAIATLLLGPVVQALFGFVTVFLVETGLYS